MYISMLSHRSHVDKDLILLSVFTTHFVKTNMIGKKDIGKVGIQKISSFEVACIHRCIAEEQILNSQTL